MSTLYSIVLILGGLCGLIYGLVDLLKPSTAIRWQVRATDKADGARRSVGLRFQTMVGIDETPEPWDNPQTQRFVRWIGAILSLVCLSFVAGGVTLWAHTA